MIKARNPQWVFHEEGDPLLTPEGHHHKRDRDGGGATFIPGCVLRSWERRANATCIAAAEPKVRPRGIPLDYAENPIQLLISSGGGCRLRVHRVLMGGGATPRALLGAGQGSLVLRVLTGSKYKLSSVSPEPQGKEAPSRKIRANIY